jgi:hypothetical protein
MSGELGYKTYVPIACPRGVLLLLVVDDKAAKSGEIGPLVIE